MLLNNFAEIKERKRTHTCHAKQWPTTASKIAEPYDCKCGKVPVETQNHILHCCKRYKHPTKAIKSTWDLVQFLKANPLAFGFDRSRDGVG